MRFVFKHRPVVYVLGAVIELKGGIITKTRQMKEKIHPNVCTDLCPLTFFRTYKLWAVDSLLCASPSLNGALLEHLAHIDFTGQHSWRVLATHITSIDGVISFP